MQIIDSVNGAYYAIAYAAALESSLDDKAIIQHYGLLPGKVSGADGSDTVEKGSLVIYVIDRKQDRVVWRVAAQAGVRFDATAEQRSARVSQVIAEMFQSFPAAK